MTRFLITALVLTVACKSEPDPDTNDTDTNTDTDTNVSVETGDTGPGNEFAPNAFAVGAAEFAIDADGNAVGFNGFDQAGNPVAGQVAITVIILDESATTAITVDNSCQITFAVAGPVAPSTTWATAAGVYWGFELPAGSPVVGDTCTNFEFPAEWGGDVAGVVGSWDWGFALNLMDPAIEPQLATGFGAQWAVLEPAVVGAGWYSDLLVSGGVDPNGYADGGFAIAQEVDATMTVQTDGSGQPILLDSSQIWEESVTVTPGVGAYAGQGVSFITPASALLPQ